MLLLQVSSQIIYSRPNQGYLPIHALRHKLQCEGWFCAKPLANEHRVLLPNLLDTVQGS